MSRALLTARHNQKHHRDERAHPINMVHNLGLILVSITLSLSLCLSTMDSVACLCLLQVVAHKLIGVC